MACGTDADVSPRRRSGSGEIVGENSFALTGGVGAVRVRATETAGTIRLTATHPVLGARTAEIAVRPAPPEAC